MDAFTGACLFVAGGAMGVWLTVEVYAAIRNAQMHERKEAFKREAALRARADQLEFRLGISERALSQMEGDRSREESWKDGFEAGIREGMRSQTVGDMLRLTQMRNARRIKSVNE